MKGMNPTAHPAVCTFSSFSLLSSHSAHFLCLGAWLLSLLSAGSASRVTLQEQPDLQTKVTLVTAELWQHLGDAGTCCSLGEGEKSSIPHSEEWDIPTDPLPSCSTPEVLLFPPRNATKGVPVLPGWL